MRRDRLTFAMMVGIPMMQLILFGFAINADPKQLPTAVRGGRPQRVLAQLRSRPGKQRLFQGDRAAAQRDEAERLIAEGDVQFVVSIPADFARKLVRGERPAILVEADATDPAAAGNAVGALSQLAQSALNRDLQGALQPLQGKPAPFEVRIHRRYNPEGITQYNIVPGLMGVILTMTMVMMTGLAMTRERERGTMENLLATPVRPLEVMAGKIVPYILVGYIQVTLILLAARLIFGVPILGSVVLLYAVVLAVHRRQPGGRPDVFHRGEEPDAGDADDVLLLPAVDAALRLHVPVPRHAGLGAEHRQPAAADPFPAHGARHPAEGQRPAGNPAAPVADRPVPADGGGDRPEALPQDAGLAHQAPKKHTRPRRTMVA